AMLGGAAASWPLAARAQQSERMRKVGLLMGTESDPDARARVKALRQRLGELGWSEDRNRPHERAEASSSPYPSRRLGSFQSCFARCARSALSDDSATTFTPRLANSGSFASRSASCVRQMGQCSPR